MAGNYRRRKLSQILQFCSYSQKFSPQNLAAWHSLVGKKRAICKSFYAKIVFFTNLQKFSPSKFSRYTVIYDSECDGFFMHIIASVTLDASGRWQGEKCKIQATIYSYCTFMLRQESEFLVWQLTSCLHIWSWSNI